MSQQTFLARKGEDADFAALTVDSMTINGTAISGAAVTLADDTKITLGGGADVTIEWDTAATPDELQILPAADDTVFAFGVAAATQKSFDLKWLAGEANGAASVLFDASGTIVEFNGVDLRIQDGDFLRFGDGSDVAINWDGSKLEMESTAAASTFNVGAASFVFNTTLHGSLTIGVNDTGYDVKLFGATAGKYWMWDESGDDMLVVGDSTFTGAVTVGVDDTGHDVKFFGATTGCSLLWDESEDQLVITGPADVPALKIAGAGSKSAAAYGTAGTAWADAGTPEFAADQMYMLIDIGGTVYRIPLWANA
jgi:hypothetical protein